MDLFKKLFLKENKTKGWVGLISPRLGVTRDGWPTCCQSPVTWGRNAFWGTKTSCSEWSSEKGEGKETSKLRLEWWWGVLVFILRALRSYEGLFSGEQGLVCAPKRAIFLPMWITDWRSQERMWGADQLRLRCVPRGREHGAGGRVGWRGNEGKGDVPRDS